MSSTVVAAVDVWKSSFAVSVTDATRTRLFGPTDCPMTAPALREVVARIARVLPERAVVKVGVEAAGHYHWPLLTGAAWPAGREILELNPAHVTEQRRVAGRRRVKTDAIDLAAITELMLTGRGIPIGARDVAIAERRLDRAPGPAGRQPDATKNQLLGQLDWAGGVVRAAKYGAAVGDPGRWPTPRQLYRAAGLSPMQYESAGRRRDGGISREGSIELGRALIDLGVGLWHCDRPSKGYAARLRARGKHGGIIACALAYRARSHTSAWVRGTGTTATPPAKITTAPRR